MKKILFIFGLILLVACSNTEAKNDLIHKDFKTDVDQVLSKLDEAYEEGRALNDEELNLLNKFKDKYEVGKFLVDDEEYEMNDLEKAIAHEVGLMKLFTESDESLASEKDAYEISRDLIAKYLEADEIPEAIKGQYSTYEIYEGMHSQVKEDAQGVIDAFDDVVNGDQVDVNSTMLGKLTDFITVYEDLEFKIDDKSYLLDDDGASILYEFKTLKEALDKGSLDYNTKDSFNRAKELIQEN